MISFQAQRRHIKGLDFLVQVFGIYVLIHSLLDVSTSNLMKYGCAVFFIIEKLLSLKRAISNPTLEFLIDQIFHLDIQIMNKNYKKKLSFNWLFLLASFILTLFECLYFENDQQLYQFYILACLFTFYLVFYQDWISAVDALLVQYIVLSMLRLYYLRYNFREVAITISCELLLVYFGYIACFDSKENKGALNIKEVTLGLFLSMALGITLPFNANKREFILKDKIFKILGQTQGFFSLHVLVTFKSLFFHYALFTRVAIILYIPIFLYRLFRQFNFFLNGPYQTSLDIDCNSHNKLFRQISDEVITCKIVFLHFNANWACDQMDLLHKINKNTLFTYELHHGALVSQVQFEQHNRNDVLTVNSNNLSVLIFALYMYSVNLTIPNLKIYFDVSKFKQTPQYQLDYYLIRYPFVQFYSKQLTYDGEEVPFQLSPIVRSYQRDVKYHVQSLIIYQKLIKDIIKQFRYEIFCDLNE